MAGDQREGRRLSVAVGGVVSPMSYLLNGTLHPDDAPAISARDRGLTLGDGVFETIAVREGGPVRLARHLERLHDGLRTLEIAGAPDRETLAADIARLLAAQEVGRGVLRLTVTRGPAGRGLSTQGCGPPSVLITASPMQPPREPLSLTVAKSVRRNEFSPASRIKSLSYLDNVLAYREAEQRGHDDALLCNSAGFVAETAIANIFAIINGELVTPPVAEGALPGIAREVVMESFPVTTAPLSLAELLAAEEAFVTNSLCVRRVRGIDGEPIGDPEMDTMTQMVRKAVHDE